MKQETAEKVDYVSPMSAEEAYNVTTRTIDIVHDNYCERIVWPTIKAACERGECCCSVLVPNYLNYKYIIQKLKDFGYELIYTEYSKDCYDEDNNLKIVIDWSKGGKT